MTKLWRHEVSADWLQARRDVLTASEIRAMLPEYKRMLKKKPGEISPGFFALCGAKLSHDDPDPISTGAAARGHIMEPYAIIDWNVNECSKPEDDYYHWDDIVIKRNGIGYSPDGLDIPQLPEMGVQVDWSEKNNCLVVQNETFSLPSRAIEVKCYEPKNHMKNLIVDKKDREERLQVAVAFMVLPSLKHVDVLWYCPDAPVPMYKERYKKSDLKAEIEVITGMLKIFHEHMKLIREYKSNGLKPHFSEDKIYKDYCVLQESSTLSI